MHSLCIGKCRKNIQLFTTYFFITFIHILFLNSHFLIGAPISPLLPYTIFKIYEIYEIYTMYKIEDSERAFESWEIIHELFNFFSNSQQKKLTKLPFKCLLGWKYEKSQGKKEFVYKLETWKKKFKVSKKRLPGISSVLRILSFSSPLLVVADILLFSWKP